MRLLLLTLLFTSLHLILTGQEKSENKTDTAPIPEAKVSITDQAVEIDGKIIELNAKAGTMLLRDENNEPIALFGFTAYFKKNPEPNRPIMFAYNGGPGSSSFWLHMGVLGPKRIPVQDPGFTPAAPYDLINNEYSVLDIADLVMIDPVGTGLSVPVGKAKFEDFWGVDQDIRSISLFITQFLIQEGRLNAPKFLLGESYGTFRNAGVMNKLLSQGIALNGVIMVSAVFDLRSLVFPPDDDLPYIVHFPTYAATAWYHHKLSNRPDDLMTFLDEVRTFTEEEYVPVLFKGNRAGADEKMAVAKKLEAYAGVSAELWMKANLRMTAGEFFQKLLEGEGEIVGRLDSRFTGLNQDLMRQSADYDPQSASISPAYITRFLDYLHNDLAVDKTANYSITAGRREGFKWDWKHEGNMRWGTQAAINTGPDMARALTRDPNMRVLIMNGIYDLATVFYGVEYSLDHLSISPEVRDNIIMEYYEAGHMMYTHQPSLVKFKEDLKEFVDETVNLTVKRP